MISTRASCHVLADPLGEPDHGQALAAALGVPDDAALAALHDASCAARTPKYWLWRQVFLMPASKTMKSWTISSSRSLPAELVKLPQQRVVAGVRVCIGLLPAQPVLLRRLDHAVAQALGVVARHHQLNGGEEGPDELLLLVVEVLPDALGHRHGGALQLQHAQRDAVDVEHDVRALGVLADDRHLLGDGEVVVLGVLPVDQPDRIGLLADVRLHLHAVAQQAVDLAVGVVERLAAAQRRGLAQLEQDLPDDLVAVPLPLQPVGEQCLLDVAVAVAVLPVAEVGVAQRVLEELRRRSAA